MTEVLRSIDAIADRYDAMFCDLWGVVHNGRTPYAEAVENCLKEKGYEVSGWE